jgi:hypothetical protein
VTVEDIFNTWGLPKIPTFSRSVHARVVKVKSTLGDGKPKARSQALTLLYG